MHLKLFAALLLVAGGVLLAPLERHIARQGRQERYGQWQVTLQLRDQMGQNAAIALLAGFRAIVADFIWIWNQSLWEKREWVRQFQAIELATFLQPQAVIFWDVGAWHMAWNIGYAERTNPDNATKAEGLKRERFWQERAQEFLARGIQNNPNRYELYFAKGWLLLRKFGDPCRAADWFLRASTFSDAPSYTGRMYAHALERCGRRQEAYEYWKRLWRGGNPEPFHDPINARVVIERELRRLERELQVNDGERVFPATPAAATTR